MRSYPLTQAGFDALRSKLLSIGITIPGGTDGTIDHRGIVLKYHFDGAQLAVSVQKKPFLIPTGEIWKAVDSWIGV